AAGDSLSLSFAYLSNESFNTGHITDDFAFIDIDGAVGFMFPGNCAMYPFIPGIGSPASPTGFSSDCSYRSVQATFTTTGLHLLGFGVIDTGLDPAFNTAILLDHITVTAQPEIIATPEPATWLLLTSGLAGLIWIKSRSRNGLL